MFLSRRIFINSIPTVHFLPEILSPIVYEISYKLKKETKLRNTSWDIFTDSVLRSVGNIPHRHASIKLKSMVS